VSSSILINSFYNPARGGHAPGDLRDAFGEAVDAFTAWSDGEPEPTVEFRESNVTITALCGYLWNCRDIMPSLMVTALDDLVGGRKTGCDAAPMPPGCDCSNQ
jgi:hypothetical protein